MTFSDLAKVLQPFYAGELTIPEFTKELLLRITDYSDAVLKYKRRKNLIERNDKTFASYYYNEKPITPIAKLIAADDHIKPDKFMSYLKRNEFDNNKKEKLCKSIEEYVTNKELNIENIFGVICDEYVKIIKLSAASSKTKQALSSIDINSIEEVNITETIKAVEPNASTQLNALSKNVKEEIRKVLSDIFTSLKAMDAFAVEYQCFQGLTKENKDEEKESKVLNSLKKEFDNFEELETKLFSYTDIYPEQTILKDLCIKMMDISLFYYIDSETYLKSIKVIDKSNEILKDSEDCQNSINLIDESKRKLKSLINALS